MNLKRLIPIPLVLTFMAGCGGAAQLSAQATAPAASAAANGAPAAARAVAGAAPAQPGAPVQANQAAQVNLPPVPPLDRMVVKNANLAITVEDPEATLNQVDLLVKTEQGTILNQTVHTQDDKTTANLTIQVPHGNFEETLAKLRDLRAHGTRVLTDTVGSQDVTDQFVDLDAQYRNLQATRDAYQKLLDKATAVNDIITLTREVAQIQTQMDQIKGRQNVLSHQSDVSSIVLSITPVGVSPVPSPRPLPQPVQAARDAWQALQTILQGLAVVVIWMAILLPVPALLLTGGWLVYRRLSRPAAV